VDEQRERGDARHQGEADDAAPHDAVEGSDDRRLDELARIDARGVAGLRIDGTTPGGGSC
jgi:hypothetical protein